jgi:hypothetical protein
MSEVYEFIDESHKKDENCLTVDFYFDSDIQKEQAVAMVERICKGVGIKYIPTLFAKSPFSYGDEHE